MAEETETVTQDTSTTGEEQEETSQETSESETVTSPEELAKAKELAENYKKRAEKAEKALKEKSGTSSQTETQVRSDSQQPTLSTKDTLALIEKKVSSEDFDEVVRVAKVLGKTVSEALADKTLTTILETRAEERRTANATQVRGGSRGASKTSGTDLLRKAEQTGEVPESTEGMQDLFKARLKIKD